MKSVIPIVALLLALAAPASAGQCEDDLAQIDKALAKQELAPDERQQLEDMRKQADELCKAGHQQEGLDLTSEAKTMLNIE